MFQTTAQRLIWSLCLTVLICAMAADAAGEEDSHSGSVGLSASWQGNQSDILLPLWISRQWVVIPSLSLVHVSEKATDVGVGLGLRLNRGTGRAIPYVGVRGGFLHRTPEAGEGTTDYLAGLMFGGECFLADRFSVGVEAQVNAVFSDVNSFMFGNPNGTNINTAAAVAATFYFR
ncbi:MAG: hypothetical protein OEV49_08325 [candidate division Zixibacteria bacterium]|nr:hypothetical protein [candidate division Zixibacteria bacterium]MDH3937395.1 hypothetical protein [candidate division Zixibacteria bacterium]MDH4033395.1 hypothetical protein [candidate division Zixibacteria bacterium]